MNMLTVIKMNAKEFKGLLLENYYRLIRFTKINNYYLIKQQTKNDLLLFATKLIKKYLMLKYTKNTIIYF